MSKTQPELIEQAKVKSDPFGFQQSFSPLRSSRRQKYIAALKSGKHTQARKTLRAQHVKRIVSYLAPSMKELMSYNPNTPIIPVDDLVVKTEYSHAFCAIGLAYELLNGDWGYPTPYIYSVVRNSYGLKINEVIKLNDNGLSFEEIAYEIELNPWKYWDNAR